MAGDEDDLLSFHPAADDGHFSVGRLHLISQPFQGKAHTADDGQIWIHIHKAAFSSSLLKCFFRCGGISGGRKTPFSVIRPDTSSRGVASKAGL